MIRSGSARETDLHLVERPAIRYSRKSAPKFANLGINHDVILCERWMIGDAPLHREIISSGERERETSYVSQR